MSTSGQSSWTTGTDWPPSSRPSEPSTTGGAATDTSYRSERPMASSTAYKDHQEAEKARKRLIAVYAGANTVAAIANMTAGTPVNAYLGAGNALTAVGVMTGKIDVNSKNTTASGVRARGDESLREASNRKKV